MTVVAALAGAILLLSDWGRRGLAFGGGASRRDSGSGGGGGVAVLFVRLDRRGRALPDHRADRLAGRLPRSASTSPTRRAPS